MCRKLFTKVVVVTHWALQKKQKKLKNKVTVLGQINLQKDAFKNTIKKREATAPSPLSPSVTFYQCITQSSTAMSGLDDPFLHPQ